MKAHRLSALGFQVGVLTALLALGACGDDEPAPDDAGTSGSGGTKAGNGGSGKGGAGGGRAGAGGASAGRGGSNAGTGGSRAGSGGAGGSRTSSQAEIDGVCKVLVDCSLIPGAPLTMAECQAGITDECVECSMMSAGADAGDACAGADDGTCSTQCSYLVKPPADKAQCLQIVASSQNTNTEAYNECLCSTCLEEFAACVADDACWRISQCASAKKCNGMACYAPATCMAEIDAAGVTSPAVTLATELGNCTTPCGT